MSWEQINVLVPLPDCDTDGGVITAWRDARPEPTQAEIDAVTQTQIDDMAIVDFRKLARQAADQTIDHLGIQARAIIEILNKRDNFNTNRIIELQDALTAMKASTGGIANLRAAIPGTLMNTDTRPRADAIQDYKDEIDSGGSDT